MVVIPRACAAQIDLPTATGPIWSGPSALACRAHRADPGAVPIEKGSPMPTTASMITVMGTLADHDPRGHHGWDGGGGGWWLLSMLMMTGWIAAVALVVWAVAHRSSP